MNAERPRRVLVFHLFGTLVDAERGLSTSLARELGLHEPALLARLAESAANALWNLQIEAEDYRPAEQLWERAVATALAAEEFPHAAAPRVAASICDWPLVDGATTALGKLARRFELALVGNLSGPSLRRFADRLGAPVAHVVGADRVGCYLPEPDHLLALMHEMEREEEDLLYVTSDESNDLITAAGLGVPAAWINRRGRPRPDEPEQLIEVRDLDRLADRLLRRRRS